MVKKLFKEEMLSYTRNLTPIRLILIGIALLTRFIQFFENESIAYDITFGSSVVVLVIAILVCLVMSVVICIRRFYSNLFTNEGYLTFTLPVNNDQIIISKLLGNLVQSFLTDITVVVSVMIATAGEVLVELFKAAGFLLEHYFTALKVDGAFYIFEFILLIIVSLISSFLLFYACITLGQTAKKHRVLAAVGIYFGYYYACQILGTIFTIVFATYYEFFNFEPIINFISENPRASLHIGLVVMIILQAIIAFVYYIITRFVLKKKLNLE